MRRLCGALLCVALLWLLCLPAAAAPAESAESAEPAEPADTAQLYAQQLSASGGDTLTERLPADTRALLEELQVDVSRPESFTGVPISRRRRPIRPPRPSGWPPPDFSPRGRPRCCHWTSCAAFSPTRCSPA